MEKWFGYISLVLAVFLPPVGAILGAILLKHDYSDVKALVSVVIGLILSLAMILTTLIRVM